jgi:hypothetical protein
MAPLLGARCHHGQILALVFVLLRCPVPTLSLLRLPQRNTTETVPYRQSHTLRPRVIPRVISRLNRQSFAIGDGDGKETLV